MTQGLAQTRIADRKSTYLAGKKKEVKDDDGVSVIAGGICPAHTGPLFRGSGGG